MRMISKLSRITTILIILHLIVLFGGRWGWGIPESIGRLFFLDQEHNIPAFYSSFLFALSGYYCIWFGCATKRDKKLLIFLWIFIGMLLLFFAADEWLGLHEKLIIPLRTFFEIQKGIFYFAWTIVYTLLVAVVGVFTLPWLRALKPAFRKELVKSASIYVSGALILEMVGSWVYSTNEYVYSPTYANIVTLEESLELIGLTLAATTLHRYQYASKKKD